MKTFKQIKYHLDTSLNINDIALFGYAYLACMTYWFITMGFNNLEVVLRLIAIIAVTHFATLVFYTVRKNAR